MLGKTVTKKRNIIKKVIVMEKRPVVHQFYSAGEEAEKNLSGVMGTLKELGYSGVAFAGFYGYSATVFCQLRNIVSCFGKSTGNSIVDRFLT